MFVVDERIVFVAENRFDCRTENVERHQRNPKDEGGKGADGGALRQGGLLGADETIHGQPLRRTGMGARPLPPAGHFRH